MFSKFSEDVQKVLINAKKEMLNLKHVYVGSEHIILSMLSFDNSFSTFLKKYNINYLDYRNKLLELVGIGNSSNSNYTYTPLLKKILEEAVVISRDKDNLEIELDDIVMAIFSEEEGVGIKVLKILGINNHILDEYYNSIKKNTKKEDKKLLIDEYGIDLTMKASLGNIDPVIGRDKEIKRIIEILCRKYKNNPLLIGNAGVGKTAIVEALAKLIVDGLVPDKIKNKRIISISLSSLVANTKYRGEFEERVTKILKELESSDNIILFIDEIHTIMGAGGAEGAIDAANIFKPALSRGNIKLIGATTLSEYKETIEKDKAMERRFEQVLINEPTSIETLEILKGIRKVYENFHNVNISDKVLEEIVSLSSIYIHDRYEPDRSIDILDDVCSKASLTINKNIKKIKDLELKLESIKKEKDMFLIHDDFKNAYRIRTIEKNILNEIDKLEKKKLKSNGIKQEYIYEVVANKSGIPLTKILKYNEKDLAKYLSKHIIGQNEAINELVGITRKYKYNLMMKHKPISCLFAGSSGCGKTELATLYGKYLFNNVIRFDGSEYSDKESINKILGSPSGYVGYDDNKNKLEEVRNNPYSLILFDNVEKASKEVLNLFIEMLDSGKINDNKGNTIYFNNTVIIFTTNLINKQTDIGFIENTDNKNIKLKENLSKELVSRVKNIVYFNKLNYDNIYCILKKEIKAIKSNLNNKNACFSIGNNDIDLLIQKSNYMEDGARKIEALLEDYVDKYVFESLIFKKSVLI